MAIQGIPSAVIDKITKLLGLQTAVDKTTFDLLNTVQPIVDTAPDRFTEVLGSGSSGSTGSTTVLTAESGKRDTFITGIWLSVMKDSSCDNTTTQVTAVINGATVNLIDIRSITLTATDNNIYVPFEKPLKIDRGSAILLSKTFAAGVLIASANAFGYTVDE